MVSTAISSFIRALFYFKHTASIKTSARQTCTVISGKEAAFFPPQFTENILHEVFFYPPALQGLVYKKISGYVLFRFVGFLCSDLSRQPVSEKRKKGGKVTKSSSVESALHSSLLDLSSEPKKHLPARNDHKKEPSQRTGSYFV